MAETKTNKPDLSAFNKALERYKTSAKSILKASHECAALALQHFAEHGDTTPMKTFYDTMGMSAYGKNLVRRAAFAKWCVHFAPVVLTEGKFKKDQTRKDMKINLEEALKVEFWNFAPDMEATTFTAKDILEATRKMVKRYENENRYKPADEAAEKIVADLESFVSAHENRYGSGA